MQGDVKTFCGQTAQFVWGSDVQMTNSCELLTNGQKRLDMGDWRCRVGMGGGTGWLGVWVRLCDNLEMRTIREWVWACWLSEGSWPVISPQIRLITGPCSLQLCQLWYLSAISFTLVYGGEPGDELPVLPDDNSSNIVTYCSHIYRLSNSPK